MKSFITNNNKRQQTKKKQLFKNAERRSNKSTSDVA